VLPPTFDIQQDSIEELDEETPSPLAVFDKPELGNAFEIRL
jgi:hypothetical protein